MYKIIFNANCKSVFIRIHTRVDEHDNMHSGHSSIAWPEFCQQGVQSVKLTTTCTTTFKIKAKRQKHLQNVYAVYLSSIFSVLNDVLHAIDMFFIWFYW